MRRSGRNPCRCNQHPATPIGREYPAGKILRPRPARGFSRSERRDRWRWCAIHARKAQTEFCARYARARERRSQHTQSHTIFPPIKGGRLLGVTRKPPKMPGVFRRAGFMAGERKKPLKNTIKSMVVGGEGGRHSGAAADVLSKEILV